jgi:hypothetical protein
VTRSSEVISDAGEVGGFSEGVGGVEAGDGCTFSASVLDGVVESSGFTDRFVEDATYRFNAPGQYRIDFM